MPDIFFAMIVVKLRILYTESQLEKDQDLKASIRRIQVAKKGYDQGAYLTPVSDALRES